MKLEDIGFYTLSDNRARNSSINSPLWRCELLLTNRCNFHCPYCRGLQGVDITLKNAEKILLFWFIDNLKNIRFSGGEPTLYKHLPKLISLCKSNGVEHIAISTNGSAETSYYLDLIKIGVNDISISLDACCSSTNDKMTGVKDIWLKVIENIKVLSKHTYLTVGVVYNEDNEDELLGTVKFAHELGVSDIRIIPSAQYSNKLSLDIGNNIISKHPILKYRLSHHRKVRGLISTDNKKCKLVLDDMAVWNGYHYPCIIYLREGGSPIGKVSPNMRKERYYWYLKHNSFNDKICNANCLDVCCEFNNKG